MRIGFSWKVIGPGAAMPRPDLPPGVPVEAASFVQEVGYLEADLLAVGDPTPDVPFFTPEGEEFRLDRFRGVTPVVLIFGSHT